MGSLHIMPEKEKSLCYGVFFFHSVGTLFVSHPNFVDDVNLGF